MGRARRLAAACATDADGEIIYNHPQWLVTRWQQTFGIEEATKICLANNREPELVLRVNSSLITRDEYASLLQKDGISCRFGNFSDDALILSDFHGQITTLVGYDQGFFQVQDEAPQLATLLLGPFRQKGRYLDGCAGLGGKTSHLIQLGRELALQAKQHVIIHEGSLQQLAAAGIANYDGILIDAPCSGTGVTGRHPDIRWNRRPEDLHRYQRMQLDLLNHAAPLLGPRGVLVYATCSLEPEENMEVVTAFLQSHRDFTLTDCSLVREWSACNQDFLCQLSESVVHSLQSPQ